MTWARLDDQFPWSRKVRRLTDAAFRLHVTGIVACARDLTDGIVTSDDLEEFPPMRGLDKRLSELIERGQWHERGHDCAKCVQPPTSGYVIHDYLDYNPAKADVEAERAAARDRQRKRRQARLGITDDTDVTRDSRVTHADVTRESQSPSLPVPSTPNPTRPVPSSGVLHVVGDGTAIPNRHLGDATGRAPIGLGGDA
ncbi:MAG TPA: hypothetical protein VMV41_08110 [Cellulomonadaceae bacterium]|nr:hypothetical protein [Cellulomonadaceae bacterium]